MQVRGNFKIICNVLCRNKDNYDCWIMWSVPKLNQMSRIVSSSKVDFVQESSLDISAL